MSLLKLDPHSPAAAIAAGLLLLLFGRRLYWLLVGATGFVAGVVFAERFAQLQPPLLVLAVAIAAGLVGALLAVWLQGAMVAIAGFAIGAGLAGSLFPDPGGHTYAWLPVLIGGVVGALLVVVAFDYALIALSSLGGAALLAQAVTAERPLAAAVFLAAAALGIVVQSMQLRGARPLRSA
jgi:hypothetical protein